ncbi:LysR family transcriptional regulator, partial [Bacillus altitudinis]
ASSSTINKKLTEDVYDQIISFNQMEKAEYQLKEVKSLALNVYGKSKEIYDDDISLVVNRDQLCPLRHEATRMLGDRTLFELDSFEGMIKIVEQGDGIALLPTNLKSLQTLVKLLEKNIHINYYVYERM